ncbi:MAG TPA: hypothetical protein VFE47_31955 [Tepidisphaeraceae bacterium]|jgi:hypothetical protein|nr:hypothetical protein [Tepidisphaeraceae bacterium]
MQLYECNSEDGFVSIGWIRNDFPSTPWLTQVRHDQQERTYYENAPRVSEDSDKDVSRWSIRAYPVSESQLILETGHPILRAFGLGVSNTRRVTASDWAFGSLIIIHYWVLLTLAAIPPAFLIARRGRLFLLHSTPLNASAAVSLVCCAALSLLWLRSYWVVDSITLGKSSDPASQRKSWVAFGESTSVRSCSGAICYEYDAGGLFSLEEGLHYGHWPIPAASLAMGQMYWHGFGAVDQFVHATPCHFRTFVISTPDALWVACFGLLAAFCTARLIKMRRINWRSANSFCVSCGYDLRATPDKCPECGTFAKSSKPGHLT